jgi:hypothetical protein
MMNDEWGEGVFDIGYSRLENREQRGESSEEKAEGRGMGNEDSRVWNDEWGGGSIRYWLFEIGKGSAEGKEGMLGKGVRDRGCV